MKNGQISFLLGAAVLATGGFFGSIEAGILSDFNPALIAAVLFCASLICANREKKYVILDETATQAKQPQTEACGYRAKNIPIESLALFALCILSFFRISEFSRDYREPVGFALAGLALWTGYSVHFDDKLRRTLILISIPMMLYALYQRLVIFPELAPQLAGEARSRLESGRVFATFILPAQFSAYLAILAPIAMASKMTERGIFRIVVATALVGICFGFYLAGSLSGVLSAMIAFFVMNGITRRGFAVALMLAAVAVGIASARTDIFGGVNPISLRINTWFATIHGIADSLFFGHGTASFERLYMAKYWFSGADEVMHPHSWFLKTFFEFGIIGAVLWLVMAAGIFRSIHDRSFRAAGAAFLVATLLDVCDQSFTLRMLGTFLLGASLGGRKNCRKVE